MKIDLNKIQTEDRNTESIDIDQMETAEIIALINKEDRKIAEAVGKSLERIAKLADKAASVIEKGGRLIYMGAGTSGRIGIVDAVECRPTFGVDDGTVRCLMAGGTQAFVRAAEGAEDDREAAILDLKKIGFGSDDLLVGISASGRTPYVVSGCEYARSLGAPTGCIVTVSGSKLEKEVDFPVAAVTGPEVIAGSTRMKAGTAQKMICNMISTAAMIKLGKVYRNFMVDVIPTNEKLRARALRIIKEAAGVSEETAIEALLKFKGVKKALTAILSGIDDEKEVTALLARNGGNISKALRERRTDA